MRKFTGVIKTDIEDSACEFEFEVEDNATDEEIEAAGKEVAFGHIDWYYNEELN